MKKFFLALLLLMLFAGIPVFAAESDSANDASRTVLVASWVWKTNDKIKFFRFKVDNDDPNYWDHLVDGDVTSYSLRGVKYGDRHTLYIQQSYDGEVWSETAQSEIIVEPKTEIPEGPLVEGENAEKDD